MIICGPLNVKNVERLKVLYRQSARPFYVMTVGSCSISGGILNSAYNSAGPADKNVKVDVFVPGCPPKPEAVINGLMKIKEKIKSDKKQEKLGGVTFKKLFKILGR
jgi:NADH-quinone oxidoreductase subunit B